MNRQTTIYRLKGAGLALMVWLWPVMALAASAVFDLVARAFIPGWGSEFPPGRQDRLRAAFSVPVAPLL